VVFFKLWVSVVGEQSQPFHDMTDNDTEFLRLPTITRSRGGDNAYYCTGLGRRLSSKVLLLQQKQEEQPVWKP